MKLSARKQCLWTLKEIGYQTGAGFMVGSPFQTPECLLADLHFLDELKPQMTGIGPFLPQKDTPFGIYPPGSLNLSLKMIALSRLILPGALIPATTAMETITPNGRELALNAGANVIMPNLTPAAARKHYVIYDNKFSGAENTTENISRLKQTIIRAGFVPDMSRGDAVP
jgi:biotin synthase